MHRLNKNIKWFNPRCLLSDYWPVITVIAFKSLASRTAWLQVTQLRHNPDGAAPWCVITLDLLAERTKHFCCYSVSRLAQHSTVRHSTAHRRLHYLWATGELAGTRKWIISPDKHSGTHPSVELTEYTLLDSEDTLTQDINIANNIFQLLGENDTGM